MRQRNLAAINAEEREEEPDMSLPENNELIPKQAGSLL